jgi:hypothetical protein
MKYIAKVLSWDDLCLLNQSKLKRQECKPKEQVRCYPRGYHAKMRSTLTYREEFPDLINFWNGLVNLDSRYCQSRSR